MDRVVRGKFEPINQQSWALGGFNVIYIFEQFDWNSYEASDRIDLQLTPSGGQSKE